MALAAAAALAVDAFLIEPARVEVTRHHLPLPDLPSAWEGACLVHLTDLHYGDPRSAALFEGMVRTVNALSPDLIVITGDYVVRKVAEVGPCARSLSQLKARHGIVGVLGDHDFNYSRQVVSGLEEDLRRAGVRLLRNERMELSGGLRLAGVDPATRKVWKADLGRALGDPSGPKPHLLLAHSPDIIRSASEAELPMVFCGHTHGGQVVVPFFGPPVTHIRESRKHASGWSVRGKTRMYTGRGLASHYSLRFLCRPEIAVFTLTRAG
jgi:predicted MPP superfamily phosphohydrolase